MLRDLAQDPPRPGETPTCDVCIVGSGPAGGSLAAELEGRGLRVIVLESGRAKVTARGDRLRAVESQGLFIKDYSRERVLGGASTTWAGLSSPLDPADLGERPWVPHAAAWPIPREELEAGYAAAAERFGFPEPDAYRPGGFDRFAAEGDLRPEWRDLEEKVFLARDEPQNFGKVLRPIAERDGVDVWLDATVQQVLVDPAGAARGVRVRSSKGVEFELAAPRVVLATGGIENARMLLLSPGNDGGALGNAHDQVGRYFMNHPKNYGGVLHLNRPVDELPYFFGCLYQGFAGYAGLRLREDLQAERRLLNSYVRFEPLFPWSDNEGVESLVLLVKKSGALFRFWKRSKRDQVVEIVDYSETGDDSDLQNQRKAAFDWIKVLGNVVFNLPSVLSYAWFRAIARKRPKVKRARLRNFMEMEPDPDNRVVLSETRDDDGRPLPRIISRCTDLDRRSMLAVQEVLRSEVERLGLGRLESDLTVDDPWPIDQDASHHVGTTRMGRDPRSSVVDPDLQVHGVPGLYCAGGSVFPTSGCANPTMTIVALSVRLARHLCTQAATPQA
jgi:choline dehydrogenase-like flavoprotein